MVSPIICLVIFALCIFLYIWNKLPISIVSLIGIALMIIFNIVSFKDAVSNFASSTVFLVVCMMVVGRAAFDTGLAQLIGTKIMSLAKGNERLVIVIATLVTGILSAFLSNVATLAMMISIMSGICSSNKNVKYKNIILPISMAAVLGGAATLIGSTPQVTGNGILENFFSADAQTLGVSVKQFSFFTFSIPGFLIVILLTLYVAFIGYPLGKKLWGKREDYEEYNVGENNAKSVNYKKSKMIIMAIIFVLMIMSFISIDVVGNLNDKYHWFDKLPSFFNIGSVSIIFALLCILTGCIKPKDAGKSINWNLGIWLAATLGMASGLAKSGAGDMIASWFAGMTIHPYVLFVIFMILIVVLTQFLANSTVLSIVLPITLTLTKTLDAPYGFMYYSYPIAVGLVMASAIAVATPLANATIGMSMTANYKFSDYLKYCGPFTLIALIVVLITIPIMYPVFF